MEQRKCCIPSPAVGLGFHEAITFLWVISVAATEQPLKDLPICNIDPAKIKSAMERGTAKRQMSLQESSCLFAEGWPLSH